MGFQKRITGNIPNAITCINVLSGCMAIWCVSKGTESLWGLAALEWGFIFIAVGAVADFLDGFAARSLHAYSELGKELDSLCDLVTFGVAPGIALLALLQEQCGAEWWTWVSLLIPVAGALRLARFNIDTRQATTFIGLPIPANAIFWIGYASIAMQVPAGVLSQWWCFVPVAITECWLMNSPLRMYSLKVKHPTLKTAWPQLLLVAAAAAAVTCLGLGGLMWFVVFYVLLSAFGEFRI